ncbi:MAG: tandem-95 repeat protein, partial [Nitrospirae bacterium]|nr:tandem-95 repeat protein [Nitrospirota bacterium]
MKFGKMQVVFKGAFFLFCLISLLIAPLSIQAATSPLVWSPDKIELTKEPGEVITLKATFVSRVNLKNIMFYIPQELKLNLAMWPIFFPNIRAGVSYEVNLLFLPSEDTGFYQGSIDYGVRKKKMVHEGLQIELNVSTSGNRPPAADAGQDQTVFVGSAVQLDGSGSTDPEGDPLTYAWSFVSRPAGSAATLSDPTVVNPVFTADRPGSYEIRLIVNDGFGDSAPDTVIISTMNSAPVANAGPDQTAYVGNTVNLNGSGSTDVDGDMLTYKWSFISKPAGSAAILSNPDALNPSFVVDKEGNYEIQLIVNDGIVDSAPDTVIINTLNTAPVADAGPDQTVHAGDPVSLDGSGSYDVDGDPMTYWWSLTAAPAGSAAALSDPTAVNPGFNTDMLGAYVIQLIANDGTVDSVPDTVVVSTTNSAPVANAGPDQTVMVGSAVDLDGSGSSDADGDALTYSWSFTTVPSGSSAVITDPGAVNPSFTADVAGIYVAQLIVNDGFVNGAPDTVTISVSSPGNNPPFAIDDNYTTDEDTALTVSAPGVLGNDFDIEGSPLTAILVSGPLKGSLTLNGNGSFIYTPDENFNGADSFTYKANDGSADSNTATVTITVNSINDAPVAVDDGYTTDEDAALTIAALGTLDNDTDIENDPLSAILVSGTSNGALTLNADGSFTYTPDENFNGTDSFTYKANDGSADSNTATVTITINSINDAPTADAGADQNAYINNTVQLNGSGSNDVEGDSLTYNWSFVSKPAGSVAALSDPNAVNPTFTVDKKGDYVVQLIVNDGDLDSAPDTVTITILNTAPAANAGPDQTAYVTNTVTLNGAGSTDIDGDLLTYSWSFVSRPAGSAAVLSDGSAVNPTFAIDKFGVYTVQLIVNDGTEDSAPDTVVINTLNSAPVANAGPDQTMHAGSAVNLDGSGSSDVDGDPLTYNWSFVSRPAGSAALLLGADAYNPSFTADTPGDYVIQLIVNDGTVDSASDTVVISTTNSAPVANAGPDQTVFEGNTVDLDGSGSSDFDGDPLTYLWSFTTVPAGSTAALSDTAAINPGFIADIAGTYVVQLIVNDGFVNGAPDTVEIFVQSAPPSKVTLSPKPAQMITRGSLTMTATLDNSAGAGGQLVELSASDSKITTPLSVTVPQGALSADFVIQSGTETGFADVTASSTGLTGDTSTVEVIARSFTLSSPLVGINRTVTAYISLAQPAPAGGATFNMSVGNTSIVTVSPATVTIPAGSSLGSYELTGGSTVAFTTVTANGTASGYGSKILDISVTDRLIDVPGAQELTLNQTYTFPVLIAPDAAPAGGVELTITSSNPSLVEVLTPTVTVPEGTFQTTATIRSAAGAKGSVTITASNPNFAPDKMQINITTALNILETFSNFGSSDTDSVYIRLESGGKPFNALADETVTLLSSDTACVSVGSSITIVTGQSLGTATLSYGGSAELPCTATVTASSTLFGSDTVQVTVGQSPDLGAISIQDLYGVGRVGSSLQIYYRINLPTGDHGGVNIQIESPDPSVLRIAPDAATAGTPVTEIFIPNGQTYKDFYVQGVRGATGDVTITAKSVRFTGGTVVVKIVQPVLRMSGLDTSTTTLSADAPIYVYTGILNTSGTAV